MRLKSWIQDEGLSLHAFAAEAQSSYITVFRWCAGYTVPAHEKMAWITERTGGKVTAVDFYAHYAERRRRLSGKDAA